MDNGYDRSPDQDSESTFNQSRPFSVYDNLSAAAEEKEAPDPMESEPDVPNLNSFGPNHSTTTESSYQLKMEVKTGLYF